MRAFILACLFACFAAAHASAQPEAAVARPSIRVEGDGWGAAGADQIEPVLQAVAAELSAKLPRKLTAPIVVTHTEGNPIALYNRGKDGAYLVRLHASGTHWHLYVFEFAHEFCHLLSNHDQNVPPDGNRYNQWFEESLCETASLYVLDRLASRWERSPPVPEWSQRAPKLRRFFEMLAGEQHRRLPPDVAFPSWLSSHEEQLRRNPYLRTKNELVATLLLPLFQHQPDSWEAVRYLNLHPEDAHAPFARYLRHWHDNAPPPQRSLISSIARLLGRDDDAPSTAPPRTLAEQVVVPASSVQ